MKRVLIIAGSDPSGGAGIQADIKTVTALGGYAMAAVTALTVQNTVGVTGIVPTAPDIVEDQARRCLEDIGADAIKVGMLGDVAIVGAVLSIMDDYPHIPVIVDPVMVATSGDALSDTDVTDRLRDELVPRARIATPNVPEMEALLHRRIKTSADMLDAAAMLVVRGTRGVMGKAAHLGESPIADFYYEGGAFTPMPMLRQETRHTHGTGCTLSSAIAIGLAQGMSALAASKRAQAYVAAAIQYAPGLGAGHGPLCHTLREEPQGNVFSPFGLV